MHILAFENKPTFKEGGQERSLFEILSGLSQNGIKISLIFKENGELLNRYSYFCDGVYKVTTRAFYIRDCLKIGIDIIKALRIIKRSSPDILYVNQYSDAPFAVLIGYLTGIPVVCHLRLPCPHYLSRQYEIALRNCEKLIAISKNTRNSYVNAGLNPKKIEVIYNTVDQSVFKLNEVNRSKSATNKIGYFGRLCPPKGVEELIQAFKLVSRSNPDVELHLYGKVSGAFVDYDYLEKLKILSGRLLDHKIFFNGHVSNPEKFIPLHSLIVLPSLWEEPFGRIILESMRLKTPVLASNIGGIPEILSPDFKNLLFSPGNVQEMASQINQYINWPSHSPDLGDKVYEYATNKFDRNSQIKKMKDIFQRILGNEKQ